MWKTNANVMRWSKEYDKKFNLYVLWFSSSVLDSEMEDSGMKSSSK